MNGTSILGPNGQRMVELSGERSWLTRTTGDIVSSYQWMHLDQIDPEAPVACMVLFPANRMVEPAAYVIPQANAWAFADNRGGPTPHCLKAAFLAATDMGMFPDEFTLRRIVDIIVDGMPDLIRMPSEQPGSLNIKRMVLGMEATARVNGRIVNEELL